MIQIRIQHWSKRPQGLQRLLKRVPSATVVTDDGEDPNPWRGYKLCLQELPSTGHVAVLQDDIVLCASFEIALERVVAARPDSIISLFVGGLKTTTQKHYYEAMKRGQHWVPIWFRDIHHVCALVWPVEKARAFLEWSETAVIPGHRRIPRSDDAIVGCWARQMKEIVYATIPCLAEHPDDVPSTIGRSHWAGMERGRVAINFIADDDPLAIDWSVP